LAIQLAQEEAVGIGGVETLGVVQARIPTLCRCPIHGQVDLCLGHGSDDEGIRLPTSLQHVSYPLDES